MEREKKTNTEDVYKIVFYCFFVLVQFCVKCSGPFEESLGLNSFIHVGLLKNQEGKSVAGIAKFNFPEMVQGVSIFYRLLRILTKDQ